MSIKREGQIMMQTWHGTALKRIGHDGKGGDHSRLVSLIRPNTYKAAAKDFDYFISDIYYYDPADDPYNNSGYATSGYDTGGYATSGYDTGGYDTGGYDTDGYDTGGYDTDAPSTGGYATSQYARRQHNIENW